MNLTMLDIKRIRSLRYEDGLSGPTIASIIGCSASAVHTYAPGRPGKVPNEKLRIAFEKSRLGAQEVAARMGWWNARPPYPDTPDGSRVRRTLGITLDVSGSGYRTRRTLIDAETCGLMAEAMGLMAWEVLPDDEQEAA